LMTPDRGQSGVKPPHSNEAPSVVKYPSFIHRG
jgi:hypothetical protein